VKDGDTMKGFDTMYNKELIQQVKIAGKQMEQIKMMDISLGTLSKLDKLNGQRFSSTGLNTSTLFENVDYSPFQKGLDRWNLQPRSVQLFDYSKSIQSGFYGDYRFLDDLNLNSKFVSSFSNIFGENDNTGFINAVSGLSKIFDATYEKRFITAFEQLFDTVQLNSHMDEVLDVLSEMEFEDYSIEEDGSISCDGEIITKEEVQKQIVEFISNLIDSIEQFKIDFKEKHKMAYFIICTYVTICAALDIPPIEPVKVIPQKIESMVNDYKSKYYVSKESARVYDSPSSKSKVIYFVSYGETVISENSCNGWIQVTIDAENKIYSGWIAKCNLVNYEKVKFDETVLEHEVE
jgi:hypothetical protein